MLGLVARNKGECIRLRTCMCLFRNWHMHIDLLLFQNDMLGLGTIKVGMQKAEYERPLYYLSAS